METENFSKLLTDELAPLKKKIHESAQKGEHISPETIAEEVANSVDKLIRRYPNETALATLGRSPSNPEAVRIVLHQELMEIFRLEQKTSQLIEPIQVGLDKQIQLEIDARQIPDLKEIHFPQNDVAIFRMHFPPSSLQRFKLLKDAESKYHYPSTTEVYREYDGERPLFGVFNVKNTFFPERSYHDVHARKRNSGDS